MPPGGNGAVAHSDRATHRTGSLHTPGGAAGGPVEQSAVPGRAASAVAEGEISQ